MAQRPLLLALCWAASAAGLAVLRGGEWTQEGCHCLNWKEAYTKYGVTCGQGLERYTDSMVFEGVRVAAYPDDQAVLEVTEKDICRHLFKRMNFNYAMSMRLAPFEMPDVYPLPKVSMRELSRPKTWCYINATVECNKYQPHGHHVRGTRVGVRVIEDDEDEPAVRDLSLETILAIARRDVLDLGAFLPNSCHIMPPDDKWDGAVTNPNKTDLELVKSFNRPTLVMTSDINKPRLFVYGDKVVKFQPGWPQGSIPLVEPGSVS
mmetsp:Transcript_98494/g.278959  ORF Transcript_98494/g.278959 Transcript_98494/m.278959 type:complete len:263 (+) Transcript_98494:59-847(+)